VTSTNSLWTDSPSTGKILKGGKTLLGIIYPSMTVLSRYPAGLIDQGKAVTGHCIHAAEICSKMAVSCGGGSVSRFNFKADKVLRCRIL
jgi:hypothetical protein